MPGFSNLYFVDILETRTVDEKTGVIRTRFSRDNDYMTLPIALEERPITLTSRRSPSIGQFNRKCIDCAQHRRVIFFVHRRRRELSLTARPLFGGGSGLRVDFRPKRPPLVPHVAVYPHDPEDRGRFTCLPLATGRTTLKPDARRPFVVSGHTHEYQVLDQVGHSPVGQHEYSRQRSRHADAVTVLLGVHFRLHRRRLRRRRLLAALVERRTGHAVLFLGTAAAGYQLWKRINHTTIESHIPRLLSARNKCVCVCVFVRSVICVLYAVIVRQTRVDR